MSKSVDILLGEVLYLHGWVTSQEICQNLPAAKMKSWLVAACLGLGLAPLSAPLFPIWEYFIIKSKLYSVFFTHNLRKYMAEKLRSQITCILTHPQVVSCKSKENTKKQSSVEIVENCRIQFEQKIQNLFWKPEGILYYVFLWPFFVVDVIFYSSRIISRSNEPVVVQSKKKLDRKIDA